MALDPKQLEPELARWRAQGWLGADGAAAILADARQAQTQAQVDAQSRDKAPASGLLLILGAVLFCLAAAAFIAANWAAIPRPGKLILCLGLIWAAYAAAAVARGRGAIALGHALALIGAGLFGSGLTLVSQMYHMDGSLAGLFLAWGLGALATGALLASPPSLALAGLLFLAWDATSSWDWDPYGFVKPALAHLSFPLLWSLLSLGLWRTSWRGGFHLAALGALYWVLQLGFRVFETQSFDDRLAWLAPALIGALVFAAGIAGDRHPAWRPRFERLRPGLGRALAVYGLLAAMPALIAVALEPNDFGVFEGVLLLVPSAGALWIGAAGGHRALVAWSAVWIAAALATIYVATVGSMLETSLFFLFAALGVGGVAWVARRLDRARTPELGAGA